MDVVLVFEKDLPLAGPRGRGDQARGHEGRPAVVYKPFGTAFQVGSLPNHFLLNSFFSLVIKFLFHEITLLRCYLIPRFVNAEMSKYNLFILKVAAPRHQVLVFGAKKVVRLEKF